VQEKKAGTMERGYEGERKERESKCVWQEEKNCIKEVPKPEKKKLEGGGSKPGSNRLEN